jgi:non-canonical (house-cleaning) NTP pyrophosphatase
MLVLYGIVVGCGRHDSLSSGLVIPRDVCNERRTGEQNGNMVDNITSIRCCR